MEPKKKEIVRDNKVKMLEQIMNKNFSHGSRFKIREIWYCFIAELIMFSDYLLPI